MVHLTDVEFPPDISERLLELEEEYKDGDITEKGYVRKKCKLVKSLLVKTVQDKIQKVEDDFKDGKSTEEQLISQLKELLSEVGHKVSNGCGTTPLPPSSAQENQNGLISVVNEEPMELQGDVKMEPSSSTSDEQDYDVGPSGSRSSMETDGPDDKPSIDSTAGPSCSNSPAAHDKGDTPASSSTNEGESPLQIKKESPATKDKNKSKLGKDGKRQPGIKEMFSKGSVKRKNPEDGKEESSKSGGESSLHSGEKDLGTSKDSKRQKVSDDDDTDDREKESVDTETTRYDLRESSEGTKSPVKKTQVL